MYVPQVSERQLRAEPNGRVRLLDAAEALFADKGYFGTSIRDITTAAGVPLGLATYHFRTKDEFYREVLLRRQPDMAAELEGALARAPEGDLQALLESYAYPLVEWLSSDDAGQRAYVRLLAVSGLQPVGQALIKPMLEAMEPMLERYREALGKAVPQLEPARLDDIFYVFQKALLGLCVDLKWQGHEAPSDLRALGRLTVQLVVRGVT